MPSEEAAMRALLVAIGLVLCVVGPTAASDLVPFRGTMSGTATVTPLSPPIVSVLLETQGTATHIGRFTLVAPHTVNQATLTASGMYTITAADGSTLTASLSGSATMVAPGVVSIRETGIITGGTGRFAGAWGTFETMRLFDRNTGETSGTFEGRISNPGS
jgi:hypothetical protein